LTPTLTLVSAAMTEPLTSSISAKPMAALGYVLVKFAPPAVFL
jgi:hypothetical protein